MSNNYRWTHTLLIAGVGICIALFLAVFSKNLARSFKTTERAMILRVTSIGSYNVFKLMVCVLFVVLVCAACFPFLLHLFFSCFCACV